MVITHDPFRGKKVITFQDIRVKYQEVIKLQAEERGRLQQIARFIVDDFTQSLELESPYWSVPGTNERDNYVYIIGLKKGETTRLSFEELIPDEHGVITFSVGLTIDKSAISFPKQTYFVRLDIKREGSMFTVHVGNGEYETALSEHVTGAELCPLSEVIKQSIINQLDADAPVAR